MMPRWAFGLWQSRQRYETQQQSLDVVDGFRSRRIPFDNIVQDWFYWPENAWGSHRFDPVRFPDPDGWVRAVHERHARLMISVWGKFYPGTENFEAMRSKGFLYETTLRSGFKDWVGPGYPYTFFDAFNPEARKLFWAQVERDLFRRGMDAWWMDATEPDLLPTPDLDAQRAHMHPTAMGTGSRVLNAYPLLNSQGVYEGQRAAAPGPARLHPHPLGLRRPAALRRRHLVGRHHLDVDGAAPADPGRAQLLALRDPVLDGGHRRLLRARPLLPQGPEARGRRGVARAQRPLVRVRDVPPAHPRPRRGPEAGDVGDGRRGAPRLPGHPQVRPAALPDAAVRLLARRGGRPTRRARSCARSSWTSRRTPASRRVADQFLFGPALLVSPVTEYEARRRPVVLPLGASWYDFWTGTRIAGGQTIDAPAPYDAMPVHVRAGSIVPFGPELQWTGEKPADPVTLFVYAGADGAFTLYEDDGLTYGYEKGAFSRIPVRWNDATGTLTIGRREGSFPGMLAPRTFEVVLVGKTRPVGFSFEPKPDRTVRYDGAAVEVRLE